MLLATYLAVLHMGHMKKLEYNCEFQLFIMKHTWSIICIDHPENEFMKHLMNLSTKHSDQNSSAAKILALYSILGESSETSSC